MVTKIYKVKRFKASTEEPTVPQCTREGHLDNTCPYFTTAQLDLVIPNIDPYVDLPNPENMPEYGAI